MNCSAFTIWELLLVIIIALVMAAILYPVFYKAQQKPWHHPCLSNEKQLGLCIIQYAQDNDGCLPNIAQMPGGNDTWRIAIFPYGKSKQLYQCPDRDDHGLGPDGLPRSYAANYTGDYSSSKSDTGDGAFTGGGSKPLTVAEIPDAKNLIVLCEVSRHSTPDYNIDNIAAFNPHNRTLWAGHSDGSNYLLADGHARWLKPLNTKEFWHRNETIPLTSAAVAILADAQKRAGQ
jgi:prepilin-type processing-associated H-X9-DG protein